MGFAPREPGSPRKDRDREEEVLERFIMHYFHFSFDISVEQKHQMAIQYTYFCIENMNILCQNRSELGQGNIYQNQNMQKY
jgi:hypothetical protein